MESPPERKRDSNPSDFLGNEGEFRREHLHEALGRIISRGQVGRLSSRGIPIRRVVLMVFDEELLCLMNRQQNVVDEGQLCLARSNETIISGKQAKQFLGAEVRPRIRYGTGARRENTHGLRTTGRKKSVVLRRIFLPKRWLNDADTRRAF